MLRRIYASNPSLEQSVKFRQKQHYSPYSKDPITLKSQSQNQYYNKENRKFNIRQTRKVRDDFVKRLQQHYKNTSKSNKYRSSRYVKTDQKQVNAKKTMDIWYQQRLNGIQHYHNQYLQKVIQQLSFQSQIPPLQQYQQFLNNMNKVFDHQVENHVKKCLI